MKLEIGMYVRTFNGKIWIIKSKQAISGHKKDIFNASYELMDLIEAGDLMYIDISPDNYGGIVVPRVAETQNELDKWKQRFASGECILKAVLTKEQIINNWYEVSNNAI
jgi:hypothetical protein